MSLILLVDDEAPFRRLIADRLRADGFGVHEVGNGIDALAAIQSLPIDLVLLDLRMPGGGGAELLAAVAPHPTFGRIPVIITSAFPRDVSQAAVLRSRHAAVQAVMVKSRFSLRELIAAVRDCVRSAAA